MNVFKQPIMIQLPPARRRDLEQLLLRLGFRDLNQIDWMLLDLALVHPSLDHQHNNDRLEFFGDAVLRLIVTTFLHETYPDMSVGDLSALRADLIRDEHIAEIADHYGVDQYLVVGGSARQDPKGRTRRLADAIEAILGALYLSWQPLQDDSVIRLRSWLDPHLQARAKLFLADPARHNAKAALQELTQGVWGERPDYRLISSQEWPSRFEVEAWIQGQCWGRGAGRSKKVAEMAAAREAYLALQQSLPSPSGETELS